MRELEVKILEIDVDEVEKKLVKLGARKIFSGTIENYYFDSGKKEIRCRGDSLRIRKQGDCVYLTYKERKVNSKVKERIETTVKIDDIKAMKNIFQILGIENTVLIRKKRISYQIDGIFFDIDIHLGKLKGIKPFMEIEGKTEASIFKYAKLLGYTEEDCKNYGMTDILKIYNLKI